MKRIVNEVMIYKHLLHGAVHFQLVYIYMQTVPDVELIYIKTYNELIEAKMWFHIH